MKIFRIPFHSFVDVITNSSTVIYTNYSNSKKVLKELLESFINLTDWNLEPDDMFWYDVIPDSLLDRWQIDMRFFNELEDSPTNQPWKKAAQKENKSKHLADLANKVVKGELDRPDWFDALEENEYGMTSNVLVIIPKKPEYEELASKLVKFVTSSSSVGTRDS